MANASRHAEPGVATVLAEKPWRFSFLQATRLLQRIAALAGKPAADLGTDAHPSQEFVQLTGFPSRTFPGAEVLQLQELSRPGVEPDSNETLLQMVTGFMGLYGPLGALPQHDTQRIITGIARSGEKKTRLGSIEKDFLDLLTHRLMSLFYRASTKYRAPVSCAPFFESRSSEPDLFTRSLFSLVGMGTPGLRGRQAFDDALLLEFSGLFARHPRSVVSLERMLSAIHAVPVVIRQFVGQWLDLDSDSQSHMPTGSRPLGQNCQLGRSFVMGSRVWEIQGKFELNLGPLSWEVFSQFLPGSGRLQAFAQLVRTWCGVQFDFDIRLELIGREVPHCGLAGGARLGQNSWLISHPPEENKRDAVLRLDGFPRSAG